MDRGYRICGTISLALHIGNCSPKRREKGTGKKIFEELTESFPNNSES